MNVSAQLRGLADIVERVEDRLDIEVQDARLAGVAVDDEAVRADLTVFAPIDVPEIEETETVTDLIDNEWPDMDESVGEDDEADDESADRHACDVDGCEFTTETDRGVAIHHSRVHSEDDDQPSPGEEQITTILDEHGELPSTEIKRLLETSSEHYRNVLQSMQRDGNVETRQDPDDRRRNLYRLADASIDESTDDDEESDEEDHESEHTAWCGWCGDGFETERGAKIHNGRVHDGRERILDREPTCECDGCGRMYAVRFKLTDHQNSSICGSELPENVSEDEFAEIVATADTVLEVTQALRSLKRSQVKKLLEKHDLWDEIETADARSPQQLVEATNLDDEPTAVEADGGDDSWKKYSMHGGNS